MVVNIMNYPFRRSGIKQKIKGTNLDQELIIPIDSPPFWHTIHEPTDTEISFMHAVLKIGIDWASPEGDKTVKTIVKE